MTKQNNTIIYLPEGDDDTVDRWAVVAASLRAAGITDIRRAPMPSLAFVPRQLRPAVISTMEV